MRWCCFIKSRNIQKRHHGEYQIYEYLHKRFPNLVLENCGYPSRLDYGLSRYARSNWLTDDTTDALRCRRSQIHANYVIPAYYNTAFAVNGTELQNAKDPEILDTLIRSRMLGLFGMSTMNGKMSERMSLLPVEAKDALKRNIANYKRYRHLIGEDVYHILPLSDGADQWDGIQFCKRDGTEAVVILFRGLSPEKEQTIKLRGLSIGASYTVTSFNTDKSSIVKGDGLAKTGLLAQLPKLNMSEIFLLKASN